MDNDDEFKELPNITTSYIPIDNTEAKPLNEKKEGGTSLIKPMPPSRDTYQKAKVYAPFPTDKKPTPKI